MLEKIKENASLKKLIISALVFFAVFIPMNSIVSNWMEKNNTTMMDFIFGGYGTDEVQKILGSIGESGRSFYLKMLIPDCIMGILYLNFLTNLSALALKNFGSLNQKWNLVLLLPLLGMISDWTENLMDFISIRGFPNLFSAVVKVESVATMLKFSFLALSFAFALVFFIVGFIRKKLTEREHK